VIQSYSRFGPAMKPSRLVTTDTEEAADARLSQLTFFRLAELGDDGEVFKRGDIALDFAVCG
jgi:hypothetical protein